MTRSRALSFAPVAAMMLAVAAVPAAASPPPEASAWGAQESTVVVTLRHQADLDRIRGGRWATRVKRTVRALRETAASAQDPLLTRLHQLERRGAVRDITPLWVTDAVAVTATNAVIAELAARPDVASVAGDQVVLVPAAGAPEPNQQAIGAPSLWAAGHDGQGAVVAILDSGVDASHPDLAGRWRGGANSWFDPYGQHPTPTDLSGHGTGTAGVILGGDAGGTSIGTAPGARWIAARVFNDAGGATATAVHLAFQWALDPDNDPSTADAPAVVNGSWSIGTGPGCDLTFQPDVQALRTAGILPVFAAGNYGPGASSSVSPANYPESLSVGAVSGANLVYSGSSRGPSTCGGRTRVFPDVVAPGMAIHTTDRYGLYQDLSGTSVAAPHASGAVALMVGAVQGGLSADQLHTALTGTATDLGTTGPDEVYGNGLIDVVAAYQAVQPPPPAADFTMVVSADQASVEPGSTGTFTVRVDPVGGFAGEVALTVTGLDQVPAAAGFDPGSVVGSGSSLLTVSTTASSAPGSHPFTVTGTSGELTHSVDGALVLSPPPARLEFSTYGRANPPGVAGPADDADLYGWAGSPSGGFSRTVDVTAAPYGLPAGAKMDGFDRLDDNRFYASFSDATTQLPGVGAVQDEDIVFWNGRDWSVYFDGTAHGLTSANEDLDAISVVSPTRIYFSTLGNTNPPGVRGKADDADIYRYQGGNSYIRHWDASANGLGDGADVDGFVRVDDTHFYLSFSRTDTTVTGLGKVQDEDVVYRSGTGWSVYFDGTALGLTSDSLDVDAFDVP